VDANGNGLLRVVRLDGTNPITIPVTFDEEAVWSGNGQWLAFGGKDSQGTSQVFIWDRRSKGVQQVTGKDSQAEYVFVAPAWSPDSQWLAFQTQSDTLCVVRAENASLKCFKGYLSGYSTPPVWSPDSRGILIRSNRIGKLLMGDSGLGLDLFIIRIPEGDATRITNNSTFEYWMMWVR